MDDERRKAILLALACLAILILLIIECAIMPRMGWLWIITAALDLVLTALLMRISSMTLCAAWSVFGSARRARRRIVEPSMR